MNLFVEINLLQVNVSGYVTNLMIVYSEGPNKYLLTTVVDDYVLNLSFEETHTLTIVYFI